MPVPIVRLSGVRKAYVTGEGRVEILRGVDWALDAGAFTVVRGVSGSGKSTLLNLIGGLDAADAGEIDVAGQPLHRLSPRALTKFRCDVVGFIFQFHNLIPSLTALENVLLALEAQGRVAAAQVEAGRQCLAAVGLGDKIGKFPRALSGGEQQRVAIARALVKRPPLVLADEPTGSLDEETGRTVLDLLRALQRDFGTTIIAVTHNPALSDIADRTFVMRGGHLEELPPSTARVAGAASACD